MSTNKHNGSTSTSVGRKNLYRGDSKGKGCGAMGGWLGWFRPPHHRFFKTACILHDELYILGGSKIDRKKADERLFSDMVKHSSSYYYKRQKVGSWMWFLMLSYLYYVAVRLFGSRQFNYKKTSSIT